MASAHHPRLVAPRSGTLLRPVFDRTRVEGPDYLQKNAALAKEIRRTFGDLDEIEKELKKAGKAIDSAQTLTTKYRARLTGLCENAVAPQEMTLQSAEGTMASMVNPG